MRVCVIVYVCTQTYRSVAGVVCFYYFLSMWGRGLFLFPIFIQLVDSLSRPVINSVERRSSWHIESSETWDLRDPSPISAGEFTAFQISNEIWGLFVMQPWSFLWSEVRKSNINSVASSNCHNMLVESTCINFHNSIFWSLHSNKKQMCYMLVKILNLNIISCDLSSSEFN